MSSDEYLNYATKNRREWELRGEEVVSSYIEKYTKGPSPEHAGKMESVPEED